MAALFNPTAKRRVTLIFPKPICATMNIRMAFAVMQNAHIEHTHIALHKSEFSDYVWTIEGTVFRSRKSGLGKPLPGNPDEMARSTE